MDTSRLRQETQAEHLLTEDAVPLMRADLSRAQYTQLLQGFYRIVRAWDAWAQANVPDDLRPLLEQRRNASLLADDLCLLGAEVPSDEAVPHRAMDQTAVAGDPRAVFLGRMYVMEGSTLGGQLLSRHVEEHLHLAPGEGDSYLRGYGDDTGARWREFKLLLEALPEEHADAVIGSARNMFHLFRQAMVLAR